MTNAKIALAKFTNDSIASDNSPTESVMYHAMVFITMVMMATTTEAHNRVFGDTLVNKFMGWVLG